ncbi:MAG: hypothetical protein EOO27_13980 [Comamonadaceae bacterium]|nr:MAG: hypothetical protein EOO27_13980 [Comamonadaceae bacterium]
MPDILEGTELFMRSASQSTDGGLFGDYATRLLRYRLLEEEWNETIRADNNDDLVEYVDGHLDMIVVAWGNLLTAIGKDAAVACAAEVTRSNLSKTVNGEVLRDEFGKIMKPPTYSPPDIAGVLAKYGYEVTA